MTATVDFITGSADSALVVVNSALRFRPTADQLAAIAAVNSGGTGRGASDSAVVRDSAAARPANRSPDGTGGRGGRAASTTGGATAVTTAGTTLWYIDDTGALAALRVRTGLTNGQQTVVQGPGLREGMQIIIAAATAASSGTSTSSSPFQTSTPQRGGGPPGPGF
jgi:HlyD family secretion protein